MSTKTAVGEISLAMGAFPPSPENPAVPLPAIVEPAKHQSARASAAPDAFAAQLAEFPQTYLGAEAEGRLIGVVLGTHDHRKGWINHLAVHPDYRRRGLGLRLLRACEMTLEQCGIEIIAALIEEGNSPSIALFERGGYLADVPVHYYRKLRRPDI